MITGEQLNLGIPDSEFCDSLNDVPEMKGPTFLTPPLCLVLPPFNWEIIQQAYADASWRWSMKSEDRDRYWETHEKPKTVADQWLADLKLLWTPDAPALRQHFESLCSDLREEIGCWSTCGGMIAFRDKKGRIGFGVSAELGQHIKRIKDSLKVGNKQKAFLFQ